MVCRCHNKVLLLPRQAFPSGSEGVVMRALVPPKRQLCCLWRGRTCLDIASYSWQRAGRAVRPPRAKGCPGLQDSRQWLSPFVPFVFRHGSPMFSRLCAVVNIGQGVLVHVWHTRIPFEFSARRDRHRCDLGNPRARATSTRRGCAMTIRGVKPATRAVEGTQHQLLYRDLLLRASAKSIRCF